MKSETEVQMKPSEVLEKYGWIQGQSGNCEKGFCMTGAVDFAYRHTQNRTDRYDAFDKLHNVEPVVMWLTTWNDRTGRTKEEVIARLKQAGL